VNYLRKPEATQSLDSFPLSNLPPHNSDILGLKPSLNSVISQRPIAKDSRRTIESNNQNSSQRYLNSKRSIKVLKTSNSTTFTSANRIQSRSSFMPSISKASTKAVVRDSIREGHLKPPIPTPIKKKLRVDYHKQLKQLEDKVLKEKRRAEQKLRDLEENFKVFLGVLFWVESRGRA
jgi:hypothetical protein